LRKVKCSITVVVYNSSSLVEANNTNTSNLEEFHSTSIISSSLVVSNINYESDYIYLLALLTDYVDKVIILIVGELV